MRATAKLPRLWLLHVEAPKSYWTWFYLIGAVHSLLVSLVAVFWQKTRGIQYFLHLAHPDRNDLEVITIQPHTVGFLVLFTVHTTRRFLESLFVTSFGNAKMHASSTVQSVLFDPDSITPHKETMARRVMAGLGLLLFMFSAYHQIRCNYLLTQQKRANNMKHVIPRGDWFDAVRSPLYTTKIMLYVSYLLVTGGTTTMHYLVSVWVTANQVVLSYMNSEWMEEKFRDRQNVLPKWKLAAFIW
ncbi:hypothetical protein PsorP6_012895 [Peronosclerospora sorghi]|uniref:Uncharacterized protein n=1 Tax=Peronosclerospora sorghi TaxID=230839 RepID=A0ACC0WGA5_9STRA|nr:hypothetical protein PsorP6_012895 [Peronosclerospora sorghi]